MITVGHILKPQGIKGELKVLPVTDDIGRFSDLKEVFIDDTSFQVVSARTREGYVYLTLGGITDRTAAERFPGKVLKIRRSDAVKLPDGRYFIDDMIGCIVFADGEQLGRVEQIDNFGSADVYTVRGEKILRFPFLKDLVVEVSVADRRITVDAGRLREVAVYED